MATRSGKANFAAITYGTPGPIVARFPERDPIMPRRNLRSRAYQLAAEPESEEMMQLSGSRDDNSQKTRCGLIGLALVIARASMSFHHSTISSSIRFRQLRSFLRSSIGMSARSDSLLSPTRLISIG